MSLIRDQTTASNKKEYTHRLKKVIDILQNEQALYYLFISYIYLKLYFRGIKGHE